MLSEPYVKCPTNFLVHDPLNSKDFFYNLSRLSDRPGLEGFKSGITAAHCSRNSGQKNYIYRTMNNEQILKSEAFSILACVNTQSVFLSSSNISSPSLVYSKFCAHPYLISKVLFLTGSCYFLLGYH